MTDTIDKNRDELLEEIRTDMEGMDKEDIIDSFMTSMFGNMNRTEILMHMGLI